MMKQNYFLLLLGFFVIFNVFGQNRLQNMEEKNRFSLGIMYSFDKNVGKSQISTSRYEGYTADNDQTNYSLGLGAEYLWTEHLSLNLAISYANRDFTGTYYCDVCDFITAPSAEGVQLRFVDVPIGLTYYFLPRKMRPFLSGAINNQFTVKNPEQLNAKSYVLGVQLGGGVQYEFTPFWALQAQIDYGNTLTRVFENSTSNLEILSFQLGVFRSF